MDQSPVTSEDFAILVYIISRNGTFPCISFDKSRIILIRNETDLLAVVLFRDRKPGLFRQRTDFGLGKLCQREDRAGKLLLGQVIQRICLVFFSCPGPAYGISPVFRTQDIRIMSGRDHVGPDIQAAP